ncbi:MAG: terminase gpA endonuclease subunit [Pseudomonadota bacterium]
MSLEAWVGGIVAEAVAIPEDLSVAEWAARYRQVSAESGSRAPGQWRHETAPHLLEIMEAMSPADPVEDVWIIKSAQVGASECLMNAWGHDVHLDPGPCMYVLPSEAEALKFNRIKLGPFIESTPEINERILPESVKGSAGSTATFKKYAGGFLVVAQAHSSPTLNMVTIKRLFADEITDWPDEAGKRGCPLEQAVARTTLYEGHGCKRVYNSTPGIKGHCRVEAGWEASDQRRYYTACPHCGVYQVLRPEQLRWRSDLPPYGAHFECQACTKPIERSALYGMVTDRGGRLWIRTYVDAVDPEGNPAPPPLMTADEFEAWRERPANGRAAGFHIWQAQSLLATWEGIVKSLLGATDPAKRKKHRQQIEGLTYEEKGEAPDAEKLYLGRAQRSLPAVPRDMPVLTGAVDVHAHRLEWAVYAWGDGMRSALVDFDVIEGAMDAWDPWLKFDAVRDRRFPIEGLPDHPGLKVARWALDAGYLAPRVYQYAKQRGGSTFGRLQPIAGGSEDARAAQRAPILGPARPVSYTWEGKAIKEGIDRRDLGTWPLKVLLYEGLRLTLQGADETGVWPEASIRFGEKCSLEFFEQITAESLLTETDRHGRSRLKWVKRRARNEQLDLWCYARAMAEMLELPTLGPAAWAAEIKRQNMTGADRQPDLFGLAAEISRSSEAGSQSPADREPDVADERAGAGPQSAASQPAGELPVRQPAAAPRPKPRPIANVFGD